MAGRPCKICTSRRKAEIETEMAVGTPDRAISEMAGCSIMAVRRHREHSQDAVKPKGRGKGRPTGDRAVLVPSGAKSRHAEKLSYVEDHVARLLRAVDRELADPDRPGEYTLQPRADEFTVLFTEVVDGVKVSRRQNLQDLWRRIEAGAKSAGLDLSITVMRNRYADRPALLMRATKEFRAVLDQAERDRQAAVREEGEAIDRAFRSQAFAAWWTLLVAELEQIPGARQRIVALLPEVP